MRPRRRAPSSPPPSPSQPPPPFGEAELERLERNAFGYFLHETDCASGLVRDSTHVGSPASIAAVGLALTIYPIASERGYMEREEAAARTLATLRFFWNSPQGPEADATGHKGFFYHFLHMNSGRRAWDCELSTIDSTYLVAGALTAAGYFDRKQALEMEIRRLADALYRRTDWLWASNRGATVTHGWTAEKGFLPYRWQGYDEAMLLYVLGLGSPTHPLPARSYAAWTRTFRWRKLYGLEFLYAGPLFIHQLPSVWIDTRGIRDAFARRKGLDYFENSRRATYAQQRYAMRNPKDFAGYGEFCWGMTASEGPGPAMLTIGGVRRRFFDYVARGIPDGPDDGTLAPWAVVASLPFAPDIVLPTVCHIDEIGVGESSPYGFEATFNPTFPSESGKPCGWISPRNFGLNQGTMVAMIENYRTGLVWKLLRESPYIVAGLRRAGFRGGWLARRRPIRRAPRRQRR